MAGPSVSVRILGDTKNFSQSIKDTGAQVERTTGRMHEAFSTVLGMVNRTGVLGPFGEALDTIDTTLGDLSKKGIDAGKAMLGIGGALSGVGFGLSVLGSKDQAARQQLAASIEATGNSWDDYKDKVEEAIKANERFGDKAAETENALQILTQATNSPQTALKLLSTAADLAAAKHESLTDAATQLGKIYNGNTKLLKQFGINIDSSAAATKRADAATRRADAADRALAVAKQHLNDLLAIDATRKKQTAGQALTLQHAEEKLKTATDNAATAHRNAAAAQNQSRAATKDQATAIDQLGGKLKGQASAQADTFTGKLKAITTALEDQAAAWATKWGPALQIAGQGVAVLGAAYSGAKGLIDKHRESVARNAAAAEEGGKKASGLSKAFKGLGTAAGIVGGAIGIGAGATLTGTVLALGAALVLAAAYAYLLYRNWGIVWPQLKQWAKDVYEYVRGSWDNLIRDLKAVPGQIARIASGMWNGIADAFVEMLNFIIRAWNGLQFTVPGFSVFGAHFGGFTLGVPDIPEIPKLAQGGLITRDGLVYAHAGEAITPAPARTGPAIVINDAHFSSGVDVELFMRRAAWIVQTQKV